MVIVCEKVVENGAKVVEDVDVEVSFNSILAWGSAVLLFKLSWLPQQIKIAINKIVFLNIM